MSGLVEDIRIKRKVVLIGDPMVGKTSLIRKFVFDAFSDDYITTIGTKISRKSIDFNGSENGKKIQLTLMIWDIMGQKEYKLIHETAYQGSKGAIIVCDLTRKETLHNSTTWVTSLFNITQTLPIVFVANKSDLTDQFQFNDKELNDIALPYRAPYYKSSAKTGENVEELFKELGRMMLKEQGALQK